MIHKVYLAAPFFTPYQKSVCRQVREDIEAKGWKVFDPDLASRDIWQGRPPAECTPTERQAVLAQNMTGIRGADVVVAWMRGTGGPFTDQGVVWELGYAYSFGKPIIGFIADDESTAERVNLMMAESIDALVHASNLRMVLDHLAMFGTAGLSRFPKELTHEGAK